MRRIILGLGSVGLATFAVWRYRIMRRDHLETSISPHSIQNATVQSNPEVDQNLLHEQPTVLEQPCSPDTDQQHYEDGYGPLFHRRYSISLAHPGRTRPELMQHIKQNLHDFSPEMLAKFEKSVGEERDMQVGDEYDIRIFGPWNGAVRVAEINDESFVFVTLEGHPEAGEIRFCIEPYQNADDQSCFFINSLARSRDQLVGLSYREAGIGLEVQRQTWVTFCERVAAFAGSTLGEVEVLTEELTND